MEIPYFIVVVTRFHANKGESDDEFVMEWMQNPTAPCEVLDLQEALASETAGAQSAKLVLIHGNTGCGSGLAALRRLLEDYAKPVFPAKGADIHIYLHAHKEGNGKFMQTDFSDIFNAPRLQVLTYSGGGEDVATLDLLQKMKDELPAWIVREVESLIDPVNLGQQHLLKMREELLRLWLDFAVVMDASDPEATFVREAREDLLETYSEILRRLRLEFWEKGVWAPIIKKHLLFQLTKTLPQSRAFRGLQCWSEFWGRQSVEAAKAAVAGLQAGATSLAELEEDLARLAASVDDLLLAATQIPSPNLRAETEP